MMKLKTYNTRYLVFAVLFLFSACKHEPLVSPAQTDDHGGNSGHGGHDEDDDDIIINQGNPDTAYFRNAKEYSETSRLRNIPTKNLDTKNGSLNK